jgi:CheY-like chemotaxis protein
MRPLKTALIVDDSGPVRGMLRMLLDHAGLRVFEARDGAEALSLLEALEWQVDVVASDIQMPVMDGLALARAALTPAYPDQLWPNPTRTGPPRHRSWPRWRSSGLR